MKYKHYAPKADVTILKGSFDAYKEYMKSHCADGVYALCFTGEEPALPCPCVTYGRADKPDEQAHALFSALRGELDARGKNGVCPLPGAGGRGYGCLQPFAARRRSVWWRCRL